ncbi:FAD-binding oxidoreductase [Streptosporangium sp. NPDC004379]|uniref:FAD-binding oxidoreductase n=1 Tax=Streptosporangium sp. NPDC004379 TaxID=3366189 RepID=UPI0036C5F29D
MTTDVTTAAEAPGPAADVTTAAGLTAAAGTTGDAVARPGEPGYDAATAVFNLAAPPRPAAAVVVRTVEDVRAAIRLADAEGLSLRVHTTGHSAPAARPMRDALLIRTEMDGAVEVDPVRRVARIPAGTRWGVVAKAAAPYGLAVAHGSSPTVGVVGYLLGGGLSFYGRKVGLAANGVRAVDLVTADGELRRVDLSSDPDLFWALRGGGGGFGVVTAVEVKLFPAAQVVTGTTCWPAAHAPGLLRAWRRWTLDAPPEATTSVRVLNLPKIPDVPPMLSAGPILCVDGAVLAETGDDVAAARRYADELLGPLRAVAEPVLDTWQLTEPVNLLDTHMDPSDPVAVIGDHMLLGDLGDDGIDALLRVVGEGSGSPLISAGLRQLGGAYARSHPQGGALDRLDAPYAYSGGGVPDLTGTAEAITRHIATVREALAPWDTGWTTPTFVESHAQPQRHLSDARIAAADLVRHRVDPAGRFRDDIMPGATRLA